MTELTYSWQGDYLIPNIEVPKTKPLGFYGKKKLDYMREHDPLQYEMRELTTLFPYASEIEEKAIEMEDRLIEQMAKAYGITEELKEKDQMKWVGLMNNIKHSAQEIVLNELIYQP